MVMNQMSRKLFRMDVKPSDEWNVVNVKQKNQRNNAEILTASPLFVFLLQNVWAEHIESKRQANTLQYWYENLVWDNKASNGEDLK